jgi:uncharacterized OsmC-like protein
VAKGEVEVEDGVLVLRRIQVEFTLRSLRPEQRETAERAHARFAPHCPVYRSIHRAIAITTALHVGQP